MVNCCVARLIDSSSMLHVGQLAAIPAIYCLVYATETEQCGESKVISVHEREWKSNGIRQ